MPAYSANRLRGLIEANRVRAESQAWTIDGVVAHITICGLRVLIDAADVEIVCGYKWGLSNEGYVIARGGRLFMHRLLMGLVSGDPREVDHRRHNKTDNRRSQLRIVTRKQNRRNSRGNSGGTSPHKGVHFCERDKVFIAQIKVNGTKKRLGGFKSEVDAAAAYSAAAKRIFGEYAFEGFAA